jgi:hypothetical protein
MEPVSRRNFFKQAGSVAAVAGALAVAPVGLTSASASPRALDEPDLAASEDLQAGDHLVAHVLNARTGEISLFVGTREVRIKDRKVAARLVRATR